MFQGERERLSNFYLGLSFVMNKNSLLEMFEQQLSSFSELPIKEKDRRCTDCICTVIGAIYALTLFILAFVFMNKDNFYKTNFPTDSDKIPCSYGENSQYSYVYFPEIEDPSTRVCVSSCPKAESLEIECRTNSKVPSCLSVNIYETSSQFERLGGFCMPTDEEARFKLMQNANLGQKWGFMNNYDVIRLSLLLSLLVGIIWMSLVQCSHRSFAVVTVVAASLLLLAFGIILLADNQAVWNNSAWRIIIAVFCLILAMFFLTLVFCYRRRIKITGVLLFYAARFLAIQPVNFGFIFISLLFTIGLLVLCLFQYLAFSSHSEPEATEGDIFLGLRQSSALTILTIIEFIWGMQFLKDSFNYCVSGNAAEWYIKGTRGANCCQPVSRLLKYNFGSVVGGSFLNGFFNFINFILESIRCYPEGCCGVCAPACTTISSFCGCFFDLVRNDAYAYIYLTGIPYCNAARNCEELCNSSHLFIGSQSVMFFYRLCAHIFCVGSVVMMSYWMMKAKAGVISIDSLVLILFLSYCITTYFIDIHADAAEGLQIAYLTELELGGGNPDSMSLNFDGLKGEMRGLHQSYKDGSC